MGCNCEKKKAAKKYSKPKPNAYTEAIKKDNKRSRKVT